MVKILIVDSDNSTSSFLRSAINKNISDVKVYVSIDDEEALVICKNQKIHIILSEQDLGKSTGIDFFKRIKPIYSEVFFILMSSGVTHELMTEAVNTGIRFVIPKPITSDHIITCLKTRVIDINGNNALINSENLLKEYKEAIDISTIVSKTDVKGYITYVNDAFCEISGYESEELVGNPHSIVRHPDSDPEIFKDLWSTITKGKVWKGEVKNLKKDGSSYTVMATINPIFDVNGNIVEYFAVRKDITELVKLRNLEKNLRKDLEEAKIQLEEDLNYKNLQLCSITEEIYKTQQEMIFTLGQVAETRSQETGLHVQRVSEYSYLLAQLAGLSEKDAQTIKTVSPMHDVGKIGIPDSILNKPGKLTNAEFEFMKQHSIIGYEMLNKSERPLIKAAAIIANEHHEKWDGSGYPNKKKGEDIHIFARITALADVFDALGHDRVYKKAWPIDDILKLIKEERGKHFDPHLVDLFLSNLDKFLDLKDKLAD